MAVLAVGIHSWKSKWGVVGGGNTPSVDPQQLTMKGQLRLNVAKLQRGVHRSCCHLQVTAPTHSLPNSSPYQGGTVISRSSAPSLSPQSSVSPAERCGKGLSLQASSAPRVSKSRAVPMSMELSSAELQLCCLHTQPRRALMPGWGLNALHDITDLKVQVPACRARAGLG